MAQRPTDNQIKTAQKAVEFAQNTRAYHRRRTRPDSRQRATDVDVALAKLKAAMAPLRSYLGAVDQEPQNAETAKLEARVRAASQAIQRERRKLWKLKNPIRKEQPTHAD